MTTSKHIRIFLSSPGDVNQERKVALEVIDNLLYDPYLREKIAFNVIAWDKPGSGTPMLATMTPQSAINAGMPKPSDCDIVVVIFWARMGTPLPDEYKKKDGTGYLSGTEWEYEDALQSARTSGKPEVIIYRRTEHIMLNPDDPDFEKNVTQYNRVKKFFAQFQDPVTGAILQGYNQFEKPEDFRREFAHHLKILVQRILEKEEARTRDTKGEIKEINLWQGSPFPGLEAFSERHATIFFGRGKETDALVEKISKNRLVAVVGSSGSGKSSLVAAGAIPRLKTNAITTEQTASKDWCYLRLTPGEAPFVSLAKALIENVPSLTGDPIDFADRVDRLATTLRNKPENLKLIIEHALKDAADWAEAFLFIDQFEELFTLSTEEDRSKFAETLTQKSKKLRIVLTVRADFYHRMVEHKSLADELREGSFPLALPDQFALLEMIVQPAKRAALEIENGLAEKIVQDTGNEPGALALMAYALDEMYHASQDSKLTFNSYNQLGGVQGAIGKRAQNVFNQLNEASQKAIAKVFRELVEVDEKGIATRQRANLSKFSSDMSAAQFIKAFVQARLLVASRNNMTDAATVEVAHEALFRSWPLLATWIEETEDDLRLLRQVKNASREWDQAGRPEAFLWRHERLQPVYQMQERLGLEFDEVMKLFLTPEAERLLIQFKKLEEASLRTRLYRQMNIVDRFKEIGIPAFRVMLSACQHATGSSLDALEKAIRELIGNLSSNEIVDIALNNPNLWKNLKSYVTDDATQNDFTSKLGEHITLENPNSDKLLEIIKDVKPSNAITLLHKLILAGHSDNPGLCIVALDTIETINSQDVYSVALDIFRVSDLDLPFVRMLLQNRLILNNLHFNHQITNYLENSNLTEDEIIRLILVIGELKIVSSIDKLIQLYLSTDSKRIRETAFKVLHRFDLASYVTRKFQNSDEDQKKKIIQIIDDFQLSKVDQIANDLILQLLTLEDPEFEDLLQRILTRAGKSEETNMFLQLKRAQTSDQKLNLLQNLLTTYPNIFDYLLLNGVFNKYPTEIIKEILVVLMKMPELPRKRTVVKLGLSNNALGRHAVETVIAYIGNEEAELARPILSQIRTIATLGKDEFLRSRASELARQVKYGPDEVQNVVNRAIKASMTAQALAKYIQAEFSFEGIVLLRNALQDRAFTYTGYIPIIKSAIAILEKTNHS